MNTGSVHRHYNPDWLSDDDLVINFVARIDEFAFLRDELARVPQEGSVQHYLLVGLRGAGKTTLLKRLAVAIRRDVDLKDHLIALSFPEELYQVKNLADFWWAACEALADELDRLGQRDKADCLIAAVDDTRIRAAKADPLADAGLRVLLQTCSDLKRRPVLLIDNLDLIFQRIDKKGRKLKDPHAPAYWALREALSTTTSPIVIGGSVSLSKPFTDYDKAFYDFFIPKRLGKLKLEEVRQVLERLADAQGAPEVKDRLHARPSRVDALYELTGGNPRALGLIFELLRQGPNSRAVEDFERLMDITTPYYKARFEELSEQAQVVMHALAVRRPGDGLRFGHTAAEIGTHAGLPTGTVSAQMDVLEREDMVEKSAAHGRTQYRIAEQLFRLWLQMRGTRRIRQNVIGLTEFLEAMFDLDELQVNMQKEIGAGALADAQFSFAVADAGYATQWRQGLEAHGVDRLFQHIRDRGGEIGDYLRAGDLPEDLDAVVHMREQLQKCNGGGLTIEEQEAVLGSVELSLEQKKTSVQALCAQVTAQDEAASLRPHLDAERRRLLRYGLRETDLALLFNKRARGYLPLPGLAPQDVEAAYMVERSPDLRAMVWRLVGAREWVKFASDESAKQWLDWGLQYASEASATEWANVAGAMRRSRKFAQAEQVLDRAFAIAPSSRAWYERAVLLEVTNGNLMEAETAFRQAIKHDSADSWPWNALGGLLAGKLKRFDEAEAAYRKAIELDSSDVQPWNNLGNLLAFELNRIDEAEAVFRKAIELDLADAVSWNALGWLLDGKLNRFDEAEGAYRKAIELDPADAGPWINLGNLLANVKRRFDEAELTYRKAIEIQPADARPWNNLGILLAGELHRADEAEAAFRKAIELDSLDARPWNNLGQLLVRELNRLDEAEAVFRKAIELDSSNAQSWNNLAWILTGKPNCLDEAEVAYRKAIELDPTDAWPWNSLGHLLADKLKRIDEAEVAFRKVIELDPADAKPWNNLGRLLANELNRFDEAEVAFRKAIALDPTDAGPWTRLGALLADKLKRYDEAEVAIRKSIELDPADAKLWNFFGWLLVLTLKRLDEAEAAFRKAIELDPKDVWCWNSLGSLLADNPNRCEEAETAFRKAIELDPKNALSWSNLGSLLAKELKRFDKAEAAFRKAVELDPTDAAPWNKLGGFLANALKRFDEAELAFRKAIELDPTGVWAWSNLGNLLEAQNRVDEASEAYARCEALDSARQRYWREMRANLQTRRYTIVAREALDAGNTSETRDALGRLLAESDDIAASLVGENFVERFLAPVLASGQNAATVLDLLRDLGYEKHARPLLLAFEAAMENRPDKLADVEPEAQGAAQHMFERLTAGINRGKRPARRGARRRKSAPKAVG